MKFHCPGCQATFSVPDEKIPEGRGVRILCPKCKTPVERHQEVPAAVHTGLEELDAMPRQHSRTPQASPPTSPSSAQAVSPGSLGAFDADEPIDEESILEVVEEGVKTALLCFTDTERMDKIKSMLEQLDFYTSTASSVKLTLAKLQHNRYDMIMLDDGSEGGRQTENLILHHIQLLPMHVRRQFYLCLVSDSQQTMDKLSAFRMGVDMLLNMKDLDKAKILLIRSMKDHRSFYRVYTEELGRKGQL